MTIQHQAIPAEVARFAAVHGLSAYLETALRLIAQHFPEAVALDARVRCDPDNPPDQWIALKVVLPATVPDRRDRDERLLTAWLDAVPWPAVEKIVTVYDLT